MNRFALIIISAAIVSATGCRDLLEPARLDGLIEISAPKVFSTDTKSSEDAGRSFKFESAQYSDMDLTVTNTIGPMSDYVDTKATELTTANLNSFIMDGYLGDEIKTCKGATDQDKNNRHFMVNAEARKSSSGDWSFVNDQKWRSCVTHYFWAHTEDLPDFSVSSAPEFNQADFSFENDGTKDLLVANHVQYYDDVLPENRNNDYITGLTFKHALAEVVINTDNIVMKQYNISGGVETQTSARCTIEEIGLISKNGGNCTLKNDPDWSLTWSDLSNPGMLKVSDGNVFVIPQSTPDLTSMLYVKDNGRQIKIPLFIELGGTSVTGAPANLDAGSKYTYKLKGDVIAPYWDGVNGIHASFTGKDFHHFCVLKDLASKYVKKIKVTWTGMAESTSAGTYVWMGCETGINSPAVENYPTTSSGLDNKPLIGFAAAFTTGSGTPTMLKGKIVETAAQLKDYKLEAEFDLSNVNTNDPVSFFLVYDGGNNSGGANWSVHDLSIEVTEFKIPI